MKPEEYLHRFRHRIARHRYVNWTLSVHTRVDIDMTKADAFLETILQDGGPLITREHLWLCAAAKVLRERPLFNVAYDGFRALQARDDIHLRVSFRTENGIAFGLIAHADRLNLREMAQAHQQAQAGAKPWEFVGQPAPRHSGRWGRLCDDLMTSLLDRAPPLESLLGFSAGDEEGTFTVLNAGDYGAEDLHAVVLRPAVAMLVVMAPREDVASGLSGPKVRLQVPMAVPFCHKVMDTDAAGYFLFQMQQLLNDPIGGLPVTERGR